MGSDRAYFRYAGRCHVLPLCVYINGWKPSGLRAQQCGCGLTLGRSFTFKLTCYRYTGRGSHVEGSSRCHSPQLSSLFSQIRAGTKKWSDTQGLGSFLQRLVNGALWETASFFRPPGPPCWKWPWRESRLHRGRAEDLICEVAVLSKRGAQDSPGSSSPGKHGLLGEEICSERARPKRFVAQLVGARY